MIRRRAASIKRDVLLNMLLASPVWPRQVRAAAFRLLGMDVGARVCIESMCFFGGTRISIADGTFINYRCVLDNSASIVIGARCALGMEVLLCTSSHVLGDATARAGANTDGPIEIGDGCWLGSRVTVLPGVKIGEGCVVAAGSVVTTDCEPHGVYAGTPARRVRELEHDGATLAASATS